MKQASVQSRERRRAARKVATVAVAIGAMFALGPGSAFAQAPKSPVTINVVDVAGNLALTQDAMQNFASKNPNLVAKIKTTQIPYKGGGPAVIDLLGGQVQFFFSVPVNVVTHVKNKRLRALAVTGDQRIDTLPDVPSMAEIGLPEVSLATWQGLGAPPRTGAALSSLLSIRVRAGR